MLNTSSLKFAFQVSVVVCSIFYAKVGHTSKFHGPTEFKVRCQLSKKASAEEIKKLTEMSWSVEAQEGFVIAAGSLEKIVEHNDEWKLHPPASYLPKDLYVSVPKDLLGSGKEVLVLIKRSPIYEPGKLSIIGSAFEAQWLKE